MRALLGEHRWTRALDIRRFERIGATELDLWRAERMSRSGLVIVASGALSADAFARAIDEAFARLPELPEPQRITPGPPRTSPRTVVIERPGTQTIILLAAPMTVPDLKEAPKLSIAAAILGGGAQGRLFKAVRGDLGATYGASASISTVHRDQRIVLVQASVANDLAKASLASLRATYAKWHAEGVTEAELVPARERSISGVRSAWRDIMSANNWLLGLLLEDRRLQVKAGRSRFNLQTLAAADFPRMVEARDAAKSLTLPQKALKHALGLVQFAMAVQDIRYYLNGVLLSVDKNVLRVVATDGHRLSYAAETLENELESVEAILPRKTVLELIKLLGDGDDPVTLTIGTNQVRFAFGGIEIVSKIVEGKFPDYLKVIPTTHRNLVSLARVPLAQSLNRAAILSNEKIRGVRLVFTKNALSIICTNNEQEEAEESLTIDYDGDPLDIGFNISYLLDVLNHVDCETVTVAMGDSNSSALVQMPGRDDFKYVVMPMRI